MIFFASADAVCLAANAPGRLGKLSGSVRQVFCQARKRVGRGLRLFCLVCRDSEARGLETGDWRLVTDGLLSPPRDAQPRR